MNSINSTNGGLEMEKLDPKTDGATHDIVEQNVEQLKLLFPERFTETRPYNSSHLPHLPAPRN